MKKDVKQEHSKSRTNLDYYHSPTQFRFDSWHKLSEHTARLHAKQQKQKDVSTLLQETEKLLSVLNTVEAYHAFPSDDDFELLLRLFRKKDYENLSWCVETVVRALSGGGYRLRETNLATALEEKVEDSEGYRKSNHSTESDHNKPYFEVLFVDKNAQSETRKLKRGFQQNNREEDDFVYDIVAVPSFEDALIAVLFNYNIQACVLRYEFPLRSKNHLQILQRYLM